MFALLALMGLAGAAAVVAPKLKKMGETKDKVDAGVKKIESIVRAAKSGVPAAQAALVNIAKNAQSSPVAAQVANVAKLIGNGIPVTEGTAKLAGVVDAAKKGNSVAKATLTKLADKAKTNASAKGVFDLASKLLKVF